MNECTDIDLITEVERYLAAVELFRAERCEPTWRPELAPSLSPDLRGRPDGAHLVTDRQHGTTSSH